jgi:hypothetical protein
MAMEIPLRGVGVCGVVLSWCLYANCVVVVVFSGGVVVFAGVSSRKIGFVGEKGVTRDNPNPTGWAKVK